MPGVVLEEPFSIARFHNVIDSNDASKQFTIGLNPLDNAIVSTNADEQVDESDLVLISVQGEGIKLYSTADQKCIKSWTTPPGLVLGGSAIHRVNESTDYTFALVASGKDIPKKDHHRIIWMWKNGTDNRIAKTLDESIHSMHVSSALPGHIILVNQNGSIALMNNELDRTVAKSISSHPSGTVVWSTVFVTTNPHSKPCCVSNSLVPINSTIILTISSLDNASDRFAIYLHYYNEERRSMVPLVKAEMVLKEKPVAFTFDPTDGRITTLGSGGKWTVWRLKIKQEAGRKLVGRLDTQLSTQFQGYQLHSDKLGDVAAIAPLSEGYVAMVAPRLKENTAEHVVSIWDVKYGTLQAERTLNLADKSVCGKDKCIYKISVLSNSHLAITISALVSTVAKDTKKKRSVTDAKSTVILCPFYSEPISLMAALGKMKSTATFLGIDDDSKQESIGVTRSDMDALSSQPPKRLENSNDQSYYDSWIHSLEHAQKKENKSLSLLLKPSLDINTFTTTFFTRVLKKDVQPSPIEKSTQAYRDTMSEMQWKGKHGQDVELSHRFVSLVVQKCLENSSFWPLHVILYLLKIRHIRSSDIEGGILPILLERNEWALVPIVLENVPDIPEADLVLLLKALLAEENDGLVESTTREELFQYIIDSPHNDIFMQQALKRLTASEIPTALQLIIWRLENVQLFESSDTFFNVIEFTNALLDSHYPVIIMEPTLYEAVNKIQELTLEYTEMADQVDRLRGMLGPFERKQRQNLAQQVKEQLALQQQKERNIKSSSTIHTKQSKNKRRAAAAVHHDEQGIPVYRVEIFNF